MADDLDDGEFWLPPQFLTEQEDILLGFDTSSSTGFSSDLGSPVTDTESDEDEFVSGELTRPDNKTPNSSKLETPNPPPVSVAKKGTGYFDSSNRGKQSTPVSPLTTHNPNFHLKLQPFHLQQRTTMVGPPASTWPHRKPQSVSSSGMRAVFLGPAKRESVGTGVFLPRSLNPTEPRNKSNTNTNTKNERLFDCPGARESGPSSQEYQQQRPTSVSIQARFELEIRRSQQWFPWLEARR